MISKKFFITYLQAVAYSTNQRKKIKIKLKTTKQINLLLKLRLKNYKLFFTLHKYLSLFNYFKYKTNFNSIYIE